MVGATCVSCRDVCLAIESNSFVIVKEFLSRGGDPNANVQGDTPTVDEIVIVRRKWFKLIHLAVLNCFRVVSSEEGGSWSTALCIVDALVGAGGRVDAKANFVCRKATNLAGGGRQRLDYTPLALSLLLKKELKLMSSGETIRTRLDCLMEKLLPASLGMEDTVPVSQSVVNTYTNLLFSQDYSDIIFICSDGIAIPAHKVILAAASPYFKTAFDGPWSENDERGEWKTLHPSSVIKVVLKFVYTGDADDVGDNLLPILAVAGEFDIPSLKELAVSHCIESVTSCAGDIEVDDFKDMLQLAHLHNVVDLKTACFQFAKRNAVKVLTDVEILNLRHENDVLWKEFEYEITKSADTTSQVETS